MGAPPCSQLTAGILGGTSFAPRHPGPLHQKSVLGCLSKLPKCHGCYKDSFLNIVYTYMSGDRREVAAYAPRMSSLGRRDVSLAVFLHTGRPGATDLYLGPAPHRTTLHSSYLSPAYLRLSLCELHFLMGITIGIMKMTGTKPFTQGLAHCLCPGMGGRLETNQPGL